MKLRHNHLKSSVRWGLTLVEMLVALALSVFMMAILSEAFVEGLKSFAQLKALGDLDDRLRTVANVLRRDLRAPHFEGAKRLSECTASGKPMPRLEGLRAIPPYTANEVVTLLAQLQPYQMVSPKLGFFSVEEWPNRGLPTDGMYFEGLDSQGRPSYRDITDVLHFTVHLTGNEEEKFFYGQLRGLDTNGNPSPLDNAGFNRSRYDNNNNRMYSSQWAELLYFLGDDASAGIPGAGTAGGPVRTFNLYRRRLLLVPDQFSNGAVTIADTSYSAATAINFFRENDLSAYQLPGTTSFLFNTPADVQHRSRRYQAGLAGFPHRTPKINVNTGLLDGGDLLLTNVISFDIKVWDPFAYRVPLTPASGRGAYVDIGDVVQINSPVPGGNPNLINPAPTAAGGDALLPVYGGALNNALVGGIFDTGTNRNDEPPVVINNPPLVPASSPRTHLFPFNSIQITIRVYEPKSKQTRQITIIQDM